VGSLVHRGKLSTLGAEAPMMGAYHNTQISKIFVKSEF
jgi:hypothetical protein